MTLLQYFTHYQGKLVNIIYRVVGIITLYYVNILYKLQKKINRKFVYLVGDLRYNVIDSKMSTKLL